jgi:hypothetical protein
VGFRNPLVKGVSSRSCGSALVFVDGTAKTWLADHRAGRGLNSGGRVGWREVEAPVGSVPVVVPDITSIYDGYGAWGPNGSSSTSSLTRSSRTRSPYTGAALPPVHRPRSPPSDHGNAPRTGSSALAPRPPDPQSLAQGVSQGLGELRATLNTGKPPPMNLWGVKTRLRP